LKELGLTLEEIRRVINLYFEDPTGIKGKQKILEILQSHLKDTEQKIDALAQFRSELQAKVARTQQWLDKRTNN